MVGDGQPLETVHDVVRREQGAVVEPHAVAQPEGPAEPVPRRRPLHGQPRLDVAAALAVLDQGVKDLAADQSHGTVDGRGGIERGRHRREPHAQDRPLGTDRAGRARQQRQRNPQRQNG